MINGTPQDRSYLPPVLLAHGAQGSDAFIIDFFNASNTWETQYKAAGGFSIDCNDGGDHITSAARRMGLGGRAMQFFAAHPYNIKPEPYAAGLPSGWPSYCKVVR